MGRGAWIVAAALAVAVLFALSWSGRAAAPPPSKGDATDVVPSADEPEVVDGVVREDAMRGGAGEGARPGADEFVVRCRSFDGLPIDWRRGTVCSVDARSLGDPAVEGRRHVAAKARLRDGLLELALPPDAVDAPSLLTVHVPGYVASSVPCSGENVAATLVRAASVELDVRGLPPGFLSGNDVTFEVFPEDRQLRAKDRQVFADGSFTDVDTRVFAIGDARQRIDGLLHGFAYAGYLMENECDEVLATASFRPPQVVPMQADCSGYWRIRCAQDVDGVLAVSDRLRTASSWNEAVPIVAGSGWLRVRDALTPDAKFSAWGSDWTGAVRVLDGVFEVDVTSADNHRVVVGDRGDCELYLIADGAIHPLGPFPARGEASCWRAGDHFVVRGAKPGQHLLLRETERCVLELLDVLAERRDLIAPAEPRAWGNVADGPGIFRRALRSFPARRSFVLVALLQVDGVAVEQMLRSRLLAEEGLEYFGEAAAWRLPQLPAGGRYVAVVRQSAQQELGRFDLEWVRDR